MCGPGRRLRPSVLTRAQDCRVPALPEQDTGAGIHMPPSDGVGKRDAAAPSASTLLALMGLMLDSGKGTCCFLFPRE